MLQYIRLLRRLLGVELGMCYLVEGEWGLGLGLPWFMIYDRGALILEVVVLVVGR